MAIQEHDPVGVNLKAGIRLGHIVDGNQVQPLAPQLVLTMSQRFVSLRGKAQDQARPAGLLPLLLDRQQNIGIRRQVNRRRPLTRCLLNFLIHKLGRPKIGHSRGHQQGISALGRGQHRGAHFFGRAHRLISRPHR